LQRNGLAIDANLRASIIVDTECAFHAGIGWLPRCTPGMPSKPSGRYQRRQYEYDGNQPAEHGQTIFLSGVYREPYIPATGVPSKASPLVRFPQPLSTATALAQKLCLSGIGPTLSGISLAPIQAPVRSR
jgi:hypothetical protein